MNKLNCFQVAHLNVRSLTAHHYEFKNIVFERGFDVMGVSESWLNDSIPNNAISLRGYNFERRDRQSRGGGVAVYVKDCYNYAVLPSDNDIEQIWLKIKISTYSFAIGIVYKPPTMNYKTFFNSLQNMLSVTLPTVDHLVCLGDFNIDFLQTDTVEAEFVCEFLEGFGMHQLVDQPTRTTANTYSLIDYILSTSKEIVSNVIVEPVDFSDHDLIACEINLEKQKSKVIYRTVRDFKYLNYGQWYADMTSIPWNNIYDLGDIESKLTFVTDNIKALLNIHAPFRTYRITKKYAPWFTDALRMLKMDRNKALTKFKKTKNQNDWNTYKTLRNMLTLMIRREKRAFFDNCFNNKSNTRNMWKNLKSLNLNANKNKEITIPENLINVNLINKHFIDSIPKLSMQYSQMQFYNTNLLSNVNFKFQTVGEIEVMNIISNIKTTATGADDINILTIRLCVPFLLPYITHIINCCIINSIFPGSWKKALITPLPKTSNICTLNDIRPISILPTFSKILEKVLEQQLLKHVSKNKIIPVHQSGFRRSHSCTTALLKVLDDIIEATDNNKLTLLILLDFSKAFDTLNHGIMFSIFKYIGLSSEASNLLMSFLSNRKQAVRYNGQISSFLNLNAGVPQGSILGPLLFSIYISNFSRCLFSCSEHYYADDSQLYISFAPDECVQAVTALNYDLSNVLDFTKAHSLKLNANKSVGIVFGRSYQRKWFVERYGGKIRIGEESVQLRDNIRNLGLYIDNDLRFSLHVSKCLQRAYINLKRIYEHRHVLNRSLKAQLCNALVLSHFNYCDVVYSPCLTLYDSQRIQLLQNSCLRLIFGIRKYERISHTLQQIKWLNMEGRRRVHSLCLFHAVVSCGIPTYLHEKIRYRTDVHNVNIRHKGKLTIPSHRTELYKRSFSYVIAKKLNELADNYSLMSKNNFKKYAYMCVVGGQ